MKAILSKYFVNILTIASIAIGVWILLTNPFKCQNGAATTANNTADSALKATAAAHIEVARLQDTLNALRKDSAQQRANVEAMAEETNIAFTARADAEDNTKKYQTKYERARKQLDTMLALISCDSLVIAIGKEHIKADAAQKACNAQVNNLGDILANRNKQISILNQQVAVLKQPANIVDEALHAVKAATKEPLIKGYLGAEADFGAGKSFLGGGPSVFLAFRGGFALKGAVKFLNGGSAYEVGGFKIISFKKK